MRVLFVEDNEINRRVMREMLRACGIDMSEAADGESGLRMIGDEDYDVVFMDLRMPGMDGLTAIRHIRARPDHKAGLPVIVVTADGGETIEADCHAAGADGMLQKPVSIAGLYDVIGALITQRRAADAKVA